MVRQESGRYTWRCGWCSETYSGDYRQSVELERQHRVNCPARPVRPAPAKRPAAPMGDRQVPLPAWPDKKYVNCSLVWGACNIQKYWEAKGGHYRGEICCMPKPCIFLVEEKKEAQSENK